MKQTTSLDYLTEVHEARLKIQQLNHNNLNELAEYFLQKQSVAKTQGITNISLPPKPVSVIKSAA